MYVVGLSSPSKVNKKIKNSVSEGRKGPCFCCVFAPFPEEGILDFTAHRPIIQVFTVIKWVGAVRGKPEAQIPC